MALPKPTSALEGGLYAIAAGEGNIPFSPATKIERYLAEIAKKEVEDTKRRLPEVTQENDGQTILVEGGKWILADAMTRAVVENMIKTAIGDAIGGSY